MKYCEKCGRIWSDTSSRKDYDWCDCCGNKTICDDGVTTAQYESMTEQEKDTYDMSITEKIKSSAIFDERLYNTYNKYGTTNFYYYFRYDKFTQMTGKRAGMALTEEEQAEWDKEFKRSMEEQMFKYRLKQNQQQNSDIPKCPTCSSTNIHKISATAKVANIALFGIFGNKRKKTFHCDNCGYEW